MLPDIPYSRFKETHGSLHMWTQIVGKFRLMQTPWINHSWQATFYVNSRGLTTSLIPGDDCAYEIIFDFQDHWLRIETTTGKAASFALEPMSVSYFYEKFCDALQSVAAPADIHHAPNEVPDPVPFAKQTDIGGYDQAAVTDFWRALVFVDGVFKHFRTGFLGKVSPVHLFWGSFDLAVTRFSGRTAPLHPGGFPALPDEITREAYSHEVSSAGFWPGGGGVDEAAFYSYAYPSPEGFKDAKVSPDAAYFLGDLGEFVLPYDVVRKSADPSRTLLDFLTTTYEAAADLGKWDRQSLECPLGAPKEPRPI